MDLILVDDSKQADKNISRPGMGSLVAIGGLHIPSASIRGLNQRLGEICDDYGFPSPQDEFKWSPSRNTWMRKNLQGEERHDFYVSCFNAAEEHEAQACVVIEDASRRSTENGRDDHEQDVVKVFLERSDKHLDGTETEAIIIADHPSGGRPAEATFAAHCLETLRDGTAYADLKNIALVLTEDSKSTRLLQLADLIVGCTVSYVGGEEKYSPDLFENHIRGLLRRADDGRIGGYGLKLHPDLRFVNLYHWLLGDAYFHKAGVGHALPMEEHPYAKGPRDPSRARQRSRL
ncbi:MAG: DUF3800 domain-containing protein [Solirubrobacterales bacterium]